MLACKRLFIYQHPFFCIDHCVLLFYSLYSLKYTVFFVFYRSLATPRPTLSHWQQRNLSCLTVIAQFKGQWDGRNIDGSLSPAST